MKHCKYCGKTMKDIEYKLGEGLCPECIETGEDNYRETFTRDILSENEFWLGDGEDD